MSRSLFGFGALPEYAPPGIQTGNAYNEPGDYWEGITADGTRFLGPPIREGGDQTAELKPPYDYNPSKQTGRGGRLYLPLGATGAGDEMAAQAEQPSILKPLLIGAGTIVALVIAASISPKR